MSFMFNPHPYDDPTPVNHIIAREDIENGCTFTYKDSMEFIYRLLLSDPGIVAVDGCPSAEFDRVENSISELLAVKGKAVRFLHISGVYKSSQELYEQFLENLPEDRVIDPVLLYGKLYKGKYETIFSTSKLNGLLEELARVKNAGETVVLIGQGSAAEIFWPFIDKTIFLDVTQKVMMLRTIAGKYKNIGDDEKRTLKMIQRRIYYVDLELAVHLRKELIAGRRLDYYIASDHDETYALLPQDVFFEALTALSSQPYRCKPVYIEGVWGGHYVRNIRKLPDVFKNIAWVFDLIPLEVSILIDMGKHVVDIPYYTFVQAMGERIMGKAICKAFDGYFPIRFNYDDTFHSSGNMSIQCHPPKDFCIEHFGEHGTQDEGYYIVATGHGAKTYCGFKNGIDPEEFLQKIEESEVKKCEVDYDKYVNSIESVPGKQFLLPGGTIHASGRDQVILEIGSLTIGSYTFKLYDYLRKDMDGNPRPIHSKYGRMVLAKERNAAFVAEHLCKGPVLIEKGDGWEEYLVGEDPLVYYSCRQLRFAKKCLGDTKDRFHVIALVDGEHVTVRSKNNPELQYHLNYLDIVVIPHEVGEYEIINDGVGPVVVYKVQMR